MSRTLTSTNPALTKRSTSGEAPPPISMTGVVGSTPSDWISYGELMAQAGDLGGPTPPPEVGTSAARRIAQCWDLAGGGLQVLVLESRCPYASA